MKQFLLLTIASVMLLAGACSEPKKGEVSFGGKPLVVLTDPQVDRAGEDYAEAQELLLAYCREQTKAGRKKIGVTIIRRARDFAKVTEGTGPEDMQRILGRLREKYPGLERRAQESAGIVTDTFEVSADFRRIYSEFNALVNSGRPK